MTEDLHQRAESMLALGNTAQLSRAERDWLHSHLENCPACRAYEQKTQDVVTALRAVPLAASSQLVQRTQLRVRMRAQELRAKQERILVVSISIILVSVTALLTTMLGWRGFQWLGGHFQLSSTIWQFGFAMFWIGPVLGTALMLLAHGTHLADKGHSPQ